MAKVREATDRDLDTLMALAEGMYRESTRYNRYPLDAEHLAFVLQTLLDAPEGCVLVVEHEGRVVGMLWGHLTAFFFSQVRIAKDVLFYIVPEQRRGWYGKALVQAFEAWGKTHGAAEIQLAVSAGIDNGRAVRFCEGLGYETMGTTLVKRGADV